MMVKELESRCGAMEKEVTDIKGAITVVKVEEQRVMSERIQNMLESFMSEIIGGKTPSISQLGESLVQKNKLTEEATRVVQINDQAYDRNKFKKVEMPIFIVISFDVVALAWYRWHEPRDQFTDWDNLRTRSLKRFRKSKEGRQCARLLAIKQEGSVAEYQEAFEALSAPLPQLSDEVLECTFLNGLDLVVRSKVLATEPQGLEQIMHRAQLVEDIATAVQEAGEGAVDRYTKVNLLGGKTVTDSEYNPYSHGHFG
ncbi:uncharacterized protein LOC111017476 [Momordica charantia]|uniref:Uncharacterized protein LOC111017476 n=1 Tax=Momordica charantia TaxID=3673 RepID=A0A6J1D5H9_MOMCH|nr:uncharacterized protein LOC111017476 [Momordica charantia]